MLQDETLYKIRWLVVSCSSARCSKTRRYTNVRHGLDHRFPRRTAGEARAQFANRMAKVEALLNLDDFPSRAGGGLESLAHALHRRCARVVELQGGRLRT